MSHEVGRQASPSVLSCGRASSGRIGSYLAWLDFGRVWIVFHILPFLAINALSCCFRKSKRKSLECHEMYTLFWEAPLAFNGSSRTNVAVVSLHSLAQRRKTYSKFEFFVDGNSSRSLQAIFRLSSGPAIKAVKTRRNIFASARWTQVPGKEVTYWFPAFIDPPPFP